MNDLIEDPLASADAGVPSPGCSDGLLVEGEHAANAWREVNDVQPVGHVELVPGHGANSGRYRSAS
jgi:hypothetical protein